MDREAYQGGGQDREDRTLIERFLAGSSSAFDSLVLRHQQRVMNICFRLTGDYEEARDCAQETFIKVYRSLGGFRLESAFSTWLYRIAVNTCKSKLASSSERFQRRAVRLDTGGNVRRKASGVTGGYLGGKAVGSSGGNPAGNPGGPASAAPLTIDPALLVSHSLSPEGEMEKREREREIQRAIDALPEDYRALVVLRDIEGLSYEEVAHVTGLALGTVKSKLARARERLRTTLKGIL